jgi:hypothetical protein
MNYAGSRVKRETAVPCANHGGIWAPHILHLNTRRVNDEIHVPGKSSRYTLNRRLGGAQRWSERIREDINVSLPPHPLA